MGYPSLLSDLEEFVTHHRPHGDLRANAGRADAKRLPAGGGLSLRCRRRALDLPDDAAIDLALLARWN